MTIEEYLSKRGLTIVELAIITEQSRQTLCNWYNNPKKTKLIHLVVDGYITKS